MQERNLISFTVEARMIYDNLNNVNVLQEVGSAIQQYGYSPSIVTFSTSPQFPDKDTGLNNSQGVDCPSYWGDSAMLWLSDALMGAIAGPYGTFGWPSNITWSHELGCGGTVGNMPSVPAYNTQPSVLDIHAYPCINQAGYAANCSSTNATNTAETFYSDVWSLLGAHNISSTTIIFGESSIIDHSDYSCPTTLPPSDTGATWAVNGYLQSSLR